MANDISVKIGLEGLGAFQAAANSFVSSIQHMNNAVLRAGTGGGGAGFVGLTAAFTAANIAAGAFFAVVRAGIDVLQDLGRIALDMTVGLNSQLEKSRVAFEGLTGSARISNAVMAELAELARKRPFELPDIVKGAQQLVGYGVAVERVIPLLNAMGSIAIATGQSTTQAFSSISRAIGQIEAAGKLRGEELRQLYNAGVPLNALFKVMAEQTGKTIAELQKMQIEGQITAEIFRAAFLTMAQNNFGDLVAAASKTLEGSLKIIQNNIAQFAATAFAPLYNRIRDVANAIAEFVSSDAFYEWANRIAGAIEAVLQGLGGLAAGFLAAMQAIVRIVVSAAIVIAKALSYLNPFARHSPSLVEEVEKGLAQIEKSYAALGRAVPSSVKAAQDAMRAFQDAIQDTMNTIEAEANRVIMGHLQLLGSAAPAAYEAAQAAIRGLQEQLKQLTAELAAQQRAVDAAAGAVDAAQQAVKAQERVIRDAERALRPYREEVERAERAVEMQGRAIAAAERALKPYEDAVSAAQDALDKAKDTFKESTDAVSALEKELNAAEQALKGFASVPLQGEEELDDAIFENELSIKKLQRSLSDLEDADAPAEAIEDLKNQIKDLEKVGKNLRLDRDIKFDPLRRELEDTADTSKELTFEEAKAGAVAARTRIDELTAQLIPARARAAEHAEAVKLQEQALATAQMALEKQKDAIIPLREELERLKLVVESARDALNEQEKAIQPLRDRLEELRDALSEAQDAYTAEQKKLSQLQKAYNDTAAAIKAMEDALKKAADEAERLAKERDAAAKGGGGGGGGGGIGDIGGAGGLELPDPFDFEAIEDKFAKFGDAFQDGFDEAKKALAPFQKDLDSVEKTLKTWAVELDKVATSLNGLNVPEFFTSKDSPISSIMEIFKSLAGFNKTVQPAVDALGQAFGRLFSAVGKLVGGEAGGGKGPLAIVIDLFGELSKFNIGLFAGVIDVVAGGLERVAGLSGELEEAQKGINDWVANGIKEFDKWSSQSIESYNKFIKETGEATAKWVTDRIEDYNKFIKETGEAVAKWVTDRIEDFKRFAATSLLTIITWAARTGAEIIKWQQERIAEFTEFFNNLDDMTGEFVFKFLLWVANMLRDAAKAILKWINDRVVQWAEFYTELGRQVAEWVNQTIADYLDLITRLGQMLSDFVTEQLEKARQFLADLLEAFQTKFEEIKTTISDKLIEIRDDVKTKIDEVMSNLTTRMEGAIGTIRDVWTRISNVIISALTPLWNFVKMIVDAIVWAQSFGKQGGATGDTAPPPDGVGDGGGVQGAATSNQAAMDFSVPAGGVLGAETGTVNNSTVNYNFSVDASYANTQSEASVRHDMEALVMMARK